MLRNALFTIILLSAGQATVAAQAVVFEEYIDRYKLLAVSEMERTGIPASIKMAQAILESNAGRSDLAVKGNNHFGIKCGNDWDGKTYKKVDDERTKLGFPKKSCFRSYPSAEESFIAHSEFLRRPRYGDLFKLDRDDYKAWARELKKAGYATSSEYPRKLIRLIEEYRLDELDQLSSEVLLAREDRPGARPRPGRPAAPADEDRPAPPARPAATAFEFGSINDVRFIVASQSAATVKVLAEQAGVRPDELLRYNENLTREDQPVAAGTRVFLQPKRSSFRGREQWHVVKANERMIDVSLAYGLSLDHLYERNRLRAGDEPLAGARLKLRGQPVDNPPGLRPPAPLPEAGERPADVVREDDDLLFEIEIEGGRPAPGGSPPVARPDTGSTPPAPQRPDGSSRPPAADDPFAKPAPPDAGAGSTADTAAVFHTVQRGETLWSISQRYQTTVDRVKNLNNLGSDQIRSGMRLRVK